MKYRHLALITLIVIGCKTDNNYGSLQIESNVDTTLARIGDVINFSVISHFVNDQIVEFPDILETESMEIRNKSVVVENDIAKSVNFEIVFWDTGKFVIPKYPVHFLKSDSIIDFIMNTDSIHISVISMLADTDDRNIRPIKDPISIKEPLNWYRLTLVLLLLFLFLIFIVLFRKRIKKTELKKISVSEKLTAIDIANNRLNDLQKIISTDNKQFYLNLSFLIREFIENQFYIRALEMTTKEIKLFKNDFDIESADFNGMINILNRSDLAKFAKYDFSISDRHSDIKWMIRFLTTFKNQI